MDNHSKGATAVICLSPYSGGMEMDAIKMAKLLISEVPVVLVAKAGCFVAEHYNDKLSNGAITLRTIKFSAKFSLSIIVETRKIIDQHRIRNIIFFGASELRSIHFAILGKDINLIIRHGTTKTSPKKDWFHRIVYSRVNYHVAICQHLAKNVQSIIPFGKNTKLKIIYPSLRENPVILKRSQRKETITLLHVGRITEGKGQKEAIEACSILYEKNTAFKFVCVGEMDRNYEKEFNDFLESKSYGKSVQIVGFDKNISQYYQNAEIFIFPSKGEGLSNAFIEALSYGLICIAFSNTSFPELNELGFELFLAKDQDMRDLQTKLLDAVAFLHGCEMPLKKQSQLAMDLFSAERELNDYLSILQ